MTPVETLLWRLIEWECAMWRRTGHRPILWWRDDDARMPSEGLVKLLDLARDHAAPLTLAVIPDVDLRALGDVVRRQAYVKVIQHGCDHLDRNKGGEFSSEFDPSEPPDDIAARINLGWKRLNETIEPSPVFAPPWNVLSSNARIALVKTPFRAISIYGAAEVHDGALIEINTHIDIMKWRPARFRGADAILLRFWRQLRSRRLQGRWEEPIGWLTHHKNLDAAAWAFLERLLKRLARPESGFQWRSVDQLLADTSSRGETKFIS